MARSKNKESKGLDLIENPEAIISKTEAFFNDKKNQNIVFISIGIASLVLLVFLGFSYLNKNKNAEAQEEMFQAVYYFEADSIGLALNGDGNNYGFLDIISLYSGTDASNLSNFYTGAIYMRLKDFNNAIRYLNDFKSNDFLLQARSYSLIGDAHMELDDFEKASNYFKKAALHKANKDFSPYYLNKYALALELKGDLKEAINAHDKIISEYRFSVLFQESQKQKARLEGLIVE
ncbi:cytochrome C biosynthesis protein [Cyclobacteriaceae bacterium]|jgi:tetratricopeptide (TPR) repeat protein|nr:cytochrome C biosynthesis protein [Cyclobacteriaceae bacterium]MDA8889335.1 cytochrome C biosynthesis protein [Cyclobacteriaceae bacterium]|tara:strand:- start:3549 stop:4250 length:702 start_codon:yes stop_codon:yes gene_type:complete